VTGVGSDGFHHPTSESEVAELVRAAARDRRRLRVRGAAHSVAHAIYTSAGGPNRVCVQSPPADGAVNVMLDRLCEWRVVDEGRKLVEADAGIHLGADPGDPTKAGTLERSLLYGLADRGWSLYDTGGVTHQTVAGFTATGSSGGSLQFTSNRNLYGFRVVDGNGETHELTREDSDLDGFHAMMPSLGLLGVVTAITFECTDLFAIEGSEAVTKVEDSPADLERFLRDQEFSRLEWWPQRGAERMLTWRAARMETPPDFEPHPYERFQGSSEATQQAVAIVFTILGNLDDLPAARRKLEDDFDNIREGLQQLKLARNLGVVGHVLAGFAATVLEGGVDVAIAALKPFRGRLSDAIPDFFPRLIDAFIPLDKHGPQRFTDWGWSGLPMDNQASDALLPTEFTEAWVPLGRTREVMDLLRTYFSEPDDDDEAYRRTGTYAWELYAAMPAPFWLSPAHSSGADEWSDGALRIDPYWFADNAADPSDEFFPGLWNLLRDHDVPFRLHWGKFQPKYERGDRRWVDYFRSQYPRWDDFLALRAERDPQDIFLTDYWRDRFGLWD
jgi:hypothetical protein